MHIVLGTMGTLFLAAIIFVGWGRYDSDRLRIIDASRRHELIGTTVDALQTKVTTRLETCVSTESEFILESCKLEFGEKSDDVYFYEDGYNTYYLQTKDGMITKVDILKP